MIRPDGFLVFDFSTNYLFFWKEEIWQFPHHMVWYLLFSWMQLKWCNKMALVLVVNFTAKRDKNCPYEREIFWWNMNISPPTT
jgi:hypothetical protein